MSSTRLTMRAALALAVFTLLAGASPRAAAQNKQNQLTITKVEVAYDAATSEPARMFIHGSNFGGTPNVTLGDVTLTLDPETPSTSGLIVVLLDQSFTPGAYLLSVSTGSSNNDKGSFNVTLGAPGS